MMRHAGTRHLRRAAAAIAMLICGSLVLAQGMTVTPLPIPGVSSPEWESHPAEDPVTGDLWFVRSDGNFLGWKLYVAHCKRGAFETAIPSPFAGPGLEADPAFVDRGRRLLFISTRATGANRSADLDIWQVVRRAGNWSAPERLPDPINSPQAEWFPRLARDGWLYFGSARGGGQGKTDIWRARQDRHRRWLVENLGPRVNGPDHEYEFMPSPDGRTALLATESGIFSVRRERGLWVRDNRLGVSINQNGTEIGPTYVGEGRDYVFSRDMGGNQSGELLVERPAGSTMPVFRCLHRRD